MIRTRKSIWVCGLLAGLCMSTMSALAQTGDPIVDYYVTSYYQYRAGHTGAPENLNPSNYGNGVGYDLLDCVYATSPSWETNCPSDLTYTPNANTGGYQAFGVGIKNWPAQAYWETECYWEDTWVWNPESHEWEFDYVYVCDQHYVQTQAEAGGVAVGRVRWGAYKSQFGIGGPYHKVSTLAFKGSSFPPCNPTLSPSGVEAPCAGTGTYVAGAGYEDKILIPDNCPLPSRTGTYIDANSGCFYSYNGLWWSDLPSPYLDTTANDGPSYYIAAIGTPNASSIQEGWTYTWRVGFFHWGNESVHGEVRHQGSLTIKKTISPFCVLFSGTFGENSACHFNVDQTLLAAPDGFN